MKIKSIKKVTPRRVYAITTSTHTFIADGLAHHNCYGCNVMHQGRQYEFAKQIEQYYGTGTADKLAEMATQSHPFKAEELLEIIEDRKLQVAFYEEQRHG